MDIRFAIKVVLKMNLGDQKLKNPDSPRKLHL